MAFSRIIRGLLMLGTVASDCLGAEDGTSYREPRFEARLFDVRSVPLEPGERQELADELVKVAYFLSDRHAQSGKALALAEAFVPQHPGARVANFRLRRGLGPAEVQMVVVDDLGATLLQGAVRLSERAGREGEGLRALGYLVEILRELPLQNSALNQTRDEVARQAPAVDWTGAFPSGLPPGTGPP